MAPAYKFVYFNGRGAGESIRFLFKYGGIDFEDHRIERKDWPALKDDTPFGQLPYLEFDGKRINQSLAIGRFVAKLVKLNGKNDLEDLEIDAVVDTLADILNKLGALYNETDEAKKKILKETVVNVTVPFYLTKFDSLVKNNGGFLAVGRLTWADITFASACSILESFIGASWLDKYPNLKALRDKVYAIPSIKKWLEVRPVTEF